MTRFSRIAALMLAMVVFACAVLVGCDTTPSVPVGTPDAAKVSTPERVRKHQEIIERGQKKAWTIGNLVTGLTRDNVLETKPTLQAYVGVGEGNNLGIIQDFSDLAKSNGELVTAVASDVKYTQKIEKRVVQLEDAERNAMKAKLNRWGFTFFVPSIIVLVLSFAAPRIPAVGAFVKGWLDLVRFVAVCGVVVGLVFFVLAMFIVPILIAVAVACAAASVVGIIWLARLGLKESARASAAEKKVAETAEIAADVVKSIDAGVAAGQIIFTDAARDPKRSIVKAYQLDKTGAFVNAVQQETGKPVPPPAPDTRPIAINIPKPPTQPTHAPNLDIEANGPASVTIKTNPAAPPAVV